MVSEINPEGSDSNSSTLALQLKLYYISFVAIFNRFSWHRWLLYVDTLQKANCGKILLIEKYVSLRLHILSGNFYDVNSGGKMFYWESLCQRRWNVKFVCTFGLVALLQIEMVVLLPPTLPLCDVIDRFQCTNAHVTRCWQRCASRKRVLFFLWKYAGNVYTTGILLFINMLILKVRG